MTSRAINTGPYGKPIRLKDRYPRLIEFNSDINDYLVQMALCSAVRAKWPTIIGFCDDSEYTWLNQSVHTALVEITKETLFPTFIITNKEYRHRKELIQLFGLKETFPCVTIWSEGKLERQGSRYSYGEYGWRAALDWIHSGIDFISLRDIKAYKLKKLYEDKLKEEGSETDGGTRVQTSVGPPSAVGNEAGVIPN